MEIVAAMSDLHPMERWLDGRMSIRELADAAGCSESHLRNLFAGRKEASLSLAKSLSDISGGAVPMDAFLRPTSAEEVRA